MLFKELLIFFGDDDQCGWKNYTQKTQKNIDTENHMITYLLSSKALGNNQTIGEHPTY